MNKHTLLIIVGALILLVAIIGGVLWFMLSEKQVQNDMPPGPGQNLFPSGTDISDPTQVVRSRSLSVPGGGTLAVSDFLATGAVTDAVNPGSYVLAGELGYCLYDGTCPKATDDTDFNISFDETTSEFTIVLLREPIGASRLEAEAFLRQKLGVKDSELCRIKYYVGVPYTVNTVYTGSNLGLSFCPGATQLP